MKSSNRLVPVDNSDAQLDEAIAYLKELKRERARMYLSEFQKFVPIFKYDGIHQLGEDKYTDLCTEWMQRVDIFEPLHVVDDGSKEVVFTLPPMFNRIASVDRVKGGHDVNTAFHNACELRDEFDNKKSLWGGYLKRVWEMANPPVELEQARSKTNQMVEVLQKQGIVSSPDVKSNSTDASPSHEKLSVRMELLGDADVEPL